MKYSFKSKRVVAYVIALTMVFSVFMPVAAWAEETYGNYGAATVGPELLERESSEESDTSETYNGYETSNNNEATEEEYEGREDIDECTLPYGEGVLDEEADIMAEDEDAEVDKDADLVGPGGYFDTLFTYAPAVLPYVEGIQIWSLAQELESFSVGHSFLYSTNLQNAGSSLTVAANNAVHVDIGAHTLGAGLDVRVSGGDIDFAAGDRVTIGIRMDGTPADGTQMLVQSSTAGWDPIDGNPVMTTANQAHEFQFTMTSEMLSYDALRICGNGSVMNFYVTYIIVSRDEDNGAGLVTLPALPTPVGTVIYSLNEDEAVQGLTVGAAGASVVLATPHLVDAGDPTFTIVEHPVSGNSIEVSGRTQGFHGIDIERGPLNLNLAVNDYRIVVRGQASAGTTIVFGGPASPWNWLGNVNASANDTFLLTVEITSASLAGTGGGAGQFANGFRIQTDDAAATATFTLDDIIVERIAGEPDLDGDRFTAWCLEEWLQDTNNTLPGIVLPWTDAAIVRDAGSILTVRENYAVEISNRDADWNGMDVRVALYPGDLIEITGSVPTPVPAGATIRLQRTPGYGDMVNASINADGTFILRHYATSAQAAGSTGVRINTNAAGAFLPITIATATVDRLEDAEPGEPPIIEIPDVDLPVLPPSYLGNYVLRAYIATGVQWDGLRLPRAALEPYLTVGGTYSFYVDIFTPQSPQGVGLMLQTNGPRWGHMIITPNYPPDIEDRHWTRFSHELMFEGRPDLSANPADILGGEHWDELQLVKRGSGTGGVFDDSRVLFFIDNLTVRNAGGNIVWQLDFEGGPSTHAPFTMSAPGGSSLEVVPSDSVWDDLLPELIVREWDMDLPSLRERFEDNFLFGNIWPSGAPTMAYTNTQDMFLHHYNAITAENAHKPDQIATSPNPATWDFNLADEIVDWAEENEIAMVGHTLVWHAQSPLWMTGRVGHETLPLITRQEAMDNMHLYVSTVAGRYAGRMYSWDVLNEVFTDVITDANWEAAPYWRAHLRREGQGLGNPNYLRWYDAFANGANTAAGECGSDFIFYAFYFARQYDPDAILYYNDFNEENPGKSKAIAQMLVEINDRWRAHPSYDGRLLIDRFGMQAHHHLDQWPTNFDNLRIAILRYIETGVGLSVTELDITIGGQGNQHPPTLPAPLTQAQQQRLADAFARVMGYYLEFSDYIYRVSLWGLTDGHSWRSWGHPLLFDGNFVPKEAFWAVLAATPNVHRPPSGDAETTTRRRSRPSSRPPASPREVAARDTRPGAVPAPTPTPAPALVSASVTSNLIQEIADDLAPIVTISLGDEIGAVVASQDAAILVLAGGELRVESGSFTMILTANQMAEWPSDAEEITLILNPGVNFHAAMDNILGGFIEFAILIDGEVYPGVQASIRIALADLSVSPFSLTAAEAATLAVAMFDPETGVHTFIEGSLDGDYFVVPISGQGIFAIIQRVPEVPGNVIPFVAPSGAVRFQIGNQSVTQGGIAVQENDVAPFIDAAQGPMLPLGAVVTSLGGTVHWIENTRTVAININGQVIYLQVDTPLTGIGMPLIVNDRTFVPIAYIEEVLGATVMWDDSTQSLYVVN